MSGGGTQRTSRLSPKRAARAMLVEECMRLRRLGLSYRAIAGEVGRSKSEVQRICEGAYAEMLRNIRMDADALVGEEIDRQDYLIRQASQVLVNSKTTATEKLRAAEVIGRCSERKLRWTGAVQIPENTGSGALPSRQQLADSEVQALNDEALDRELAALGYHREDTTLPGEPELQRALNDNP